MWRIKRKTGKIPTRRLPVGATRLSPEASRQQLELAKQSFYKMQAEIQKKVQTKAAVVLWRFWRQNKHMSLPRLVRRFKDGDITKSKISSMEFSDVVTFVRDKGTIRKTRMLFMRLHHMCEFANTTRRAYILDSVNIRVVLSAFMIVCFPSKVFEDMQDLETTLLQASQRFLSSFEMIIEQFEARGQAFSKLNASLVFSFLPQLVDFMKKFKAWKVPDEAKLICRIEWALCALKLSTEELATVGEPERTRIGSEMTIQAERLRGKYIQIRGPEKLQEFEEKLARGEMPQHVQGTNTQESALRLAQEAARNTFYTYMPGRLNNEQLAHNLLLDPEYQLDDYHVGIDPGCSAIRSHLINAFWSSIRSDLQVQPPCYTRVLTILGEIRVGIAETAGAADAERIRRLIDTDFLGAQLRTGVFEWPEICGLGASIFDIIRRTLSPRRVDEFVEKWKPIRDIMANAAAPLEKTDALVTMLRFIFDCTGTLRIDAANFRLRLIAPVIRIHGIEYEQKKLQMKLEAGTINLNKLKHYLKKAIEIAVEGGVSLDAIKAGSVSVYMQMLTEAFIHMVGKTEGLNDFMPETHYFDAYMIWSIVRDFDHVTSVCTALFALKNEFKKLYTPIAMASGSAQFASEAVALTAEVVDAVEKEIQYYDRGDFDQILGKVLATELAKTPLREDQQKSLTESILKCCKPETPIFVLFKSRITETWRTLFRKGIITPQDVAELKYNACVTGRILKSCTTARRIFDISIAVHGERYNGLIGEALAGM